MGAEKEASPEVVAGGEAKVSNCPWVQLREGICALSLQMESSFMPGLGTTSLIGERIYFWLLLRRELLAIWEFDCGWQEATKVIGGTFLWQVSGACCIGGLVPW